MIEKYILFINGKFVTRHCIICGRYQTKYEVWSDKCLYTDCKGGIEELNETI